ncbi:MAG: hypothetical protein RBT65_15320 [Methanolobus sp.]|jgi:hypothetical protein|nr:hypothetical protein [Methanolobus sp.]
MEIEKILTYLHTPNEIVLFKQALFCKVYEESAWQFCMLIKAYKPIKQYVKKVKKEIVSIGFPVSVLANITSLAKEKSFEISQPDNEGVIRITTNGSFEGSFEEWKNSIKLQEPAQSNNNYISTHLDKRKEAVIEKLKGYSLANHTPVETMTLVMELQKELAVIKPE